jgi:hypothetical protein
MDTNS